MLAVKLVAFAVVLLAVQAVEAGAPEKCSGMTLGTKTKNRVPLNPRRYAAHTSDFDVEVQSAVCTTGNYAGAELSVCDYNYWPYVTSVNKNTVHVRANERSDLSGQIFVYIVAFC